MGFQDRDYYRNDPPRGRFLGGASQVCKWLIAINIAVFLAQLMTLRAPQGGVTGLLSLAPDKVLGSLAPAPPPRLAPDGSVLVHEPPRFGFQVWRLVTYAFCHAPGSPWHIFFNMLFLWWLGPHLEALYGSREFLRFYLAGAFLAGVCHVALVLWLNFLNPRLPLPPTIGASGAVMAVTIVYAMYNPRQIIYVMFVLPVELRWLVLVYVIVDMHPVLLGLGGTPVADGVAHAAHLGGPAWGFAYKHFDLRFDRWLPGATTRIGQRARPASRRQPASVRLYEPPTDEAGSNTDFHRRVDEILGKITTHGESSLTAAEREVLKEASRRFKRP
jgi:membrane associated rhomboid family serine protease